LLCVRARDTQSLTRSFAAHPRQKKLVEEKWSSPKFIGEIDVLLCDGGEQALMRHDRAHGEGDRQCIPVIRFSIEFYHLSLSLASACRSTQPTSSYFFCVLCQARQKTKSSPHPFGRVPRRKAARAPPGGQYTSTEAYRVPRAGRAGQQVPGRVGSARKAGRPRARGQKRNLPPPARASLPNTPRAGQDDAARAHKDPLYVPSATAAARSP